MSDHDLVITELDHKIKPPKKKPRKIFLFKRADVDRLRDNISSNLQVLRQIECDSTSELDDLWCTTLDAVEQNVPSKNISGRWHVPWLTLLGESYLFLRKGQKFKDKTSFFTLNLFNGPTTLNLVRDNKHGRITKPSARTGLHYACPC